MEQKNAVTPERIAAEIMLTNAANEEEAKKTLQKLLSCRLDLTKCFPPDRNIMYFKGAAFLRKGNISIIQGKPKSGKSFMCSMLAAAAITGEYQSLTTYERRSLNKLLYFDTEQCEEDANNLARRILKMANIATDRFPDNFMMYSFRKFAPSDARDMLEMALKQEQPSFVIIDGITDIVDSPNDEAESKKRVAWLYNLADEYNTHIMLVIHENPGAFEKARGHIGSELERKIETAIRLETNDLEENKIKRAAFKLTRMKRPDDFQFTVEEGGLPRIEPWSEPLKISTSAEPKISKQEQTLQRLKDAFDGKQRLTQFNLVGALIDNAKVGETTARREIAAGEKLGFLRKEENYYVFTQAEAQAPQAELPF